MDSPFIHTRVSHGPPGTFECQSPDLQLLSYSPCSKPTNVADRMPTALLATSSGTLSHATRTASAQTKTLNVTTTSSKRETSVYQLDQSLFWTASAKIRTIRIWDRQGFTKYLGTLARAASTRTNRLRSPARTVCPPEVSLTFAILTRCASTTTGGCNHPPCGKS